MGFHFFRLGYILWQGSRDCEDIGTASHQLILREVFLGWAGPN